MDKLAVLKWQIDMGVDETIDSEPLSLEKISAQKTPAKAIIQTEKKEPMKTATRTSPLEAEKSARMIADKCKTLSELHEALKTFDEIAIKKTATNTVFSDGNPEAKIMFIGEAPGANEDIEGIPFCGASGKLMDELLKWAGFERKKNIYISNTIFWRPPGNRRPTPEELAICKPFVEKHIALINPSILVLVGGTATFSLLNTNTGISKLRGQYHEYKNDYLKSSIPAIALFHPSYLLRQPSQKKTFWFDILSMKKHLSDKNISY